MIGPRERDLQRRSRRGPRVARAALYCLGVLCACEDFDPPLAPVASAAPSAAGRGAMRPPPAASSSADAGAPPRDERARGAVARATRNHVLVVNPREHAVAVIDPRSLQVRLAACADDEPAWLVAAEDGDVALAVDAEAERACALQLRDDEPSTSRVAIVPYVNRVELSPDARFALAFHDPAAAAAGEPPRIAQELSVIDLSGRLAVSTTVLVGMQPREVAFSADSRHALVLGAAGIVRLPLARAARGEVALSAPLDYGLSGWDRAQVRFAADGEHALRFEPDSPVVQRIDLVREELEAIDLAAWAAQVAPTAVPAVPAEPRVADALIAHDGASAWLALRGTSLLVPLALSDQPLAPLDQALALSDQPLLLPGDQPSDRLQWAGDDERALLVYAREPGDGRASLVSLALPGEPQPVRLARAPDRVLSAPGGDALALLHDAPGQPAGYTLLRVRDGAARFRQSEPAPVALALARDGGTLAAVVAARGERAAELHVLDVGSLAERVHELPGVPLGVGFAGEQRYVYAQLAHPDGRLLLLELASGELRTASGFLIPERVQE